MLFFICVIPLLILGYGSYRQSKSILNEKLKVTSQTLLEVNDGIDNYFKGFSHIITMLSNNYNLVNADSSEQYLFIPELLKNTKELGAKGLSMIDTLIEKSYRTKMATTEVMD